MEPEREDHSDHKPPSRGSEENQRVSDALTDLAAYALELDTEYYRLDKRVGELTRQECSAADLWAVLSERAELAEECQEFRGVIAAFREQFASVVERSRSLHERRIAQRSH
jgi:hypothetical protein